MSSSNHGKSTDLCDNGKMCVMINLRNPISHELKLQNLFVCKNCYRMHICDLQHDCSLLYNVDGVVCAKTGFSYDGNYPAYSQRMDECETECTIDTINIVSGILSYAYNYLEKNSDHYSSIFKSITENGKFIQTIEDSVFYTFNKVFKNTLIQKVPIPVISKLFMQLIIGVNAKETIYDPHIIKVSRKKKEDNLLKRMRIEYGNSFVA